MILALDTATVTGWAAGRPGETPQWGARDFSGRGGNGEVGGKFRFWLQGMCHQLQPRLIVFESPYVPFPRKDNQRAPMMNPLTLRRLMGLALIVETTAWELRIKSFEATTGEISKFFTGTSRHGGRDQKKAATIAMCRRYGWDVAENDDAADALALWCMAEAKEDPDAALSRGVGPLFLSPKKVSAPRSSAAGRLESGVYVDTKYNAGNGTAQ